jgi:hypothetical protein
MDDGARYRLLISVQRGVHAGAAFVGTPGQTVAIGPTPDCDLVLADDGVPAEPLGLAERQGLLVAEVRGAGVRHEGMPLAAGRVAFDEPTVVLQLGGAELRVELLRRSPRPRAPAPAAPRRPWVPVGIAGVAVAALLAAGGAAVNATVQRHDLQKDQAGRTLQAVVEAFNTRGAELTAVAGMYPLVQGRVADAAMRRDLERELHGASLRPELQVHDVQQMADSLERLARLAGAPCTPRHAGAGRFACDTEAPDAAAAARLHVLVAQVPGVEALEVPVRAAPPEPAPMPAIEPITAPQAARPAPPERPQIAFPAIRHIAIGAQERIAIDAAGRRLRVGDRVGRARVTAIQFNTVELTCDGHRYTVYVTPALAATS